MCLVKIDIPESFIQQQEDELQKDKNLFTKEDSNKKENKTIKATKKLSSLS